MSGLQGIVKNLPETEYHAHSSLSSTEARILLRKGGQARYRWKKDHPPLVSPSKKFDVGSAVHSKVLGIGYEVAVIPDDMLASNGAASTKAAKEFIEVARAEGLIPMKQAELEPIEQMAEGVLANRMARAIFQQPGAREVSVFGTDPATNVPVRARFDFLPDLTLGRPVAADLKTTAKEATEDDFGYEAWKLQYDVQQEWYLDTLNFSGEDGNRPEFVFVVIEKEPPYLTGVIQLPVQFRERGKARAAEARRRYEECVRVGVWPGHPDEVVFASVPRAMEYEEAA